MSGAARWLLLIVGCVSAVVAWVFLSEDASRPGPRAPATQRDTAPIEDQLAASTSPSPAAQRTRTPTASDRKEANEIYRAEVELIKRSKEMDELRQSDKPKDIDRCMELMDELLPKATKLDERAAVLPYEFVELSTAANHMTRCVVCNHQVGRFNCVEASKMLKQISDRAKARKSSP